MCRRLYFWASLFFLSWIFIQPVHAAALRAYTGKVNASTSGIIQQKLSKYGFAANDPRFGATVAGASTGLTAIAGGAAAVAVGAATWPVILAGAAISTVVGGALYLGQDLLIDWLWGDDGKVELSGQGMGSSSPATLPMMPGNYGDLLDTYGPNQNLYFQTSQGDVRWIRTVGFPCPAEGTCTAGTYTKHRDTGFNDLAVTPSQGPYWSNTYRRKTGTVIEVVYNYTRSPEPIKAPSYQPVPLTPEEAIAAVPQSATEAQLSPEMLAAIANATWKAAQTQPNAVPWPATDPITAQDVADWLRLNPTARPTVGDLFSPVAPVGAPAVPMPLPSTSPTPTPTPGEGTDIDLGDDPNTPQPSLEDTPTAQMILGPILNLMPDLRAFSVPSVQGVCPTPTFTIFDREHRWEVHCTLMEENRALLEMAMLLVWSISAVFIVLRA